MTRRGAVEIFGVVAGVVAVASWLTSTPSMQTAATVSSRQSTASATPAGQTATRLPDGRWLLVGGEDAAGNAVLWDPQTQTTTQTAGKLQLPRAWHSATLLADGTVLLLGGRNGNVPVETPELFDPATGTFMPIPIAATAPRASHTATLLTDGRVLVVGGSNGSAVPVPTEIWELEARTATSVSVESLSRVGHTATLMADGRVLVTGGEGLDGNPASDALAIDAVGASVQHVEVLAPPPTLPVVAASILALTDGAGTTQTQYTYEPFGATTSSGATSSNAFQYTGRENDGTGLYYYRARYYSPGLQRFIAEDPIGFAGGDPNLHAYAFNSPTLYRDPSGRIVAPLILCAAGAAGSALADWMGGRKFDPIKAAAWCGAGLGLGFAGPALGAVWATAPVRDTGPEQQLLALLHRE
jgi:RHS repeat-associated protein